MPILRWVVHLPPISLSSLTGHPTFKAAPAMQSLISVGNQKKSSWNHWNPKKNRQMEPSSGVRTKHKQHLKQS